MRERRRFDKASAIYDGVVRSSGGRARTRSPSALASPGGAEAGRQLYEDEAKFIDFYLLADSGSAR